MRTPLEQTPVVVALRAIIVWVVRKDHIANIVNSTNVPMLTTRMSNRFLVNNRRTRPAWKMKDSPAGLAGDG